MSNLQTALKALSDRFSMHGLENPAFEARALVKGRLGISDADIIAHPDRVLSTQEAAQLEQDMQKRLSGMPLCKIVGEKQFWGLDFEVSTQTLSPRPDTETLIEAVLHAFPDAAAPLRFLDLGTGTGCISVTLLSVYKQAQGLAVDVSSEALAVARRNADRHGVAGRLTLMESDWFSSVEDELSFDIIVSNPPYIPSEDIESLAPAVKNYDPILALDGGKDGLVAYKKIFSGLKTHLNPHGKAFFEVGISQAEDVARLAQLSGFAVDGIHQDLGGILRVVEISHGENSKNI